MEESSCWREVVQRRFLLSRLRACAQSSVESAESKGQRPCEAREQRNPPPRPTASRSHNPKPALQRVQQFIPNDPTALHTKPAPRPPAPHPRSSSPATLADHPSHRSVEVEGGLGGMLGGEASWEGGQGRGRLVLGCEARFEGGIGGIVGGKASEVGGEGRGGREGEEGGREGGRGGKE